MFAEEQADIFDDNAGKTLLEERMWQFGSLPKNHMTMVLREITTSVALLPDGTEIFVRTRQVRGEPLDKLILLNGIT